MAEAANPFSDDEHRILEGLELGDQEANRRVYDDHSPGLFFTAMSFLDNNAEASKDIVADVFVKFMEKPRRFNTLKDVKGFLHISVRNACRNYLRKNKKAHALTDELINNLREPGTVENILIKSELYAEVWLAYNQLSESRRTILADSIFGGVSVKEIAMALGLSDNHTSKEKGRALEFLRKLLQDKYFLFTCIAVATTIIINLLRRLID